MDLSDLHHSLALPAVRTGAPPRPAPASDSDDDGDDGAVGVVTEIFNRHRKSTQAESKQVCVVLAAVLEVIKAEGLQPTPTALFAALLASLAKPEALASAEVTAAMCTILAPVAARVPSGVLRARFAPASQQVAAILEAHGADAVVARAALPCLCQVLEGLNPADWASAARPFALVLAACLDSRPKLRKRAQAGLAGVLGAVQAAPAALDPASEAVLKLCQRVLPGPEAAAHAAAAAPSKKRADAEAGITRAVTDALHLMGALKQCMALLSGPAASAVCALVLQLYPLRQPLLTRHATDTLAALCAAPASRLPPKALAEVLKAVLAGEASWDRKDAGAALGTTALLEAGLLRLVAADAGAAAALLPRAVHALVPQLASEHEGVRQGTAAALRGLLAACVGPDAVAAAVAAAGGGGRTPSAVARVVSAVEASLGAQYRDAWEACLPVATELMQRLGREGAPLAGGLVDRVGQLCAGGEDAAEDGEGGGDARLAGAAQAALGAALRSLGPEAVLQVLPLNIREGVEGRGEARAWLLPLLRAHVRGGELAYWGAELLPLARWLGARAAAAGRDPARRREAAVCSTLEAQVWALLPSFCSWALDLDEALPALTKSMASAFQKRPELRPVICSALRRVCVQCRLALRAAGEEVGHADPSYTRDDEPAPPGASEEEAVHVDVPATATPEAARATLAALRGDARTWLPLLLTAFVAAPPNARGQLEGAAAAYACVCDAPTLALLFRSAVAKLMKAVEQSRAEELGPGALTEGGDTDAERRCTFTEAALCLAGGLDAAGAGVLYRAALPGIEDPHPAVQKKGYKALAYLCESRPDFLAPNFQGVAAALLGASPASVSAAKRYRLRCLKAVVLELVRPDGADVDLRALPGVGGEAMSEDEEEEGGGGGGGGGRGARARAVLAPLVSEIVLSLKEANKRTRAAAYDLLVEVAAAAHEAEPPPPPRLQLGGGGGGEFEVDPGAAPGGLHSLFSMVLGGLVGATPHMVSASLMAMARLLFEFAPSLAGLVPELMPAALSLLRSKAREVIKSVLGFLKVVCMRLPAEELRPFVPAILEGILLWAEDSKNKFRLKVRVIMERLARRCGFEALEASVPESHRPLLTHIRKEAARRERKGREGQSEMDWEGAEEEDTKSRASRWASDVFSDDSGGEEGRGRASEGGRTARTAKTAGARTQGGKTARSGGTAAGGGAGGAGRRLPSGGDPLDLLDASTSRRLVRAAGKAGARPAGRGRGEEGDDGPEFGRGEGGRMVIREEEGEGGGKRKRAAGEDHGMDSGDSDFEDLKGFSGLELALRGSKSVAQAPSIAASLGGRSRGARTEGGRSRGGRTEGGRSRDGRTEGGRSAPGDRRGAQHSGDRFKAKGKGAAGDVKGGSRVEPYAYWPLDRKLLNRRAQKTRSAKQGLDRIVTAAKEGAARGSKAKKRARKA